MNHLYRMLNVILAVCTPLTTVRLRRKTLGANQQRESALRTRAQWFRVRAYVHLTIPWVRQWRVEQCAITYLAPRNCGFFAFARVIYVLS